jgi:hypothetical protein
MVVNWQGEIQDTSLITMLKVYHRWKGEHLFIDHYVEVEIPQNTICMHVFCFSSIKGLYLTSRITYHVIHKVKVKAIDAYKYQFLFTC